MKKYTVKLQCGITGNVLLRYYPRADQVITVTTDTGKNVTGAIAEVMRVR